MCVCVCGVRVWVHAREREGVWEGAPTTRVRASILHQRADTSVPGTLSLLRFSCMFLFYAASYCCESVALSTTVLTGRDKVMVYFCPVAIQYLAQPALSIIWLGNIWLSKRVFDCRSTSLTITDR